MRVPSLNLLARAEWDLGMAPRARRAAEQALKIGEAASPDHPDLAETHRLLAALSPDDPDAGMHAERATALAPSHLLTAPLCLRPTQETR